MNAVCADLKERDKSALRVHLDADDQESHALYEPLGFVSYDVTQDKVKYQRQIIEKPRHLPLWFLSRVSFFQVLLGIPFHVDNNERYYRESTRWQTFNVITNAMLINVLLALTFTLNPDIHRGLFIALTNLVFWLGVNGLNGLRVFKLRKKSDHLVKRYRKAIQHYLRWNSLVILIASIVMRLITVLACL